MTAAAARLNNVLLLDEGVITRLDDPDSFDINATTLEAEPTITRIPDVACFVAHAPQRPNDTGRTGNLEAQASHAVWFDQSAEICPGDFLEITASDSNPALVGQAFRLLGEAMSSAAPGLVMLAERATDIPRGPTP